MSESNPTPSTPKAEQVPQEANLGKTVANMTRHAEHHIEQRDQQVPFTPSQRQEIRHKVEVEITALIVAERERYAKQRMDEQGTLNERPWVLNMVVECDRLRRELEEANKELMSAPWLTAREIIAKLRQQLAALQRELSQARQTIAYDEKIRQRATEICISTDARIEKLNAVRLAALKDLATHISAIPESHIENGRLEHAWVLSAHRILATCEPEGRLKQTAPDLGSNAKIDHPSP